ncbi:VC0807 family protein [Streptacidiphilus sp. MAP5-3]|uniref:VC0807 family protein n=1 Tax=unclassified Streptacidiphilus TaxID=2643834 RepID=UPI00351896F1
MGIGLPLAGYYTLHALGASDWAALLAATAATGARLVAVGAWTRRVSWFAAVMLAVFGVGLALAFVGGDPRFLLLKDSFSTAALALVFLASLLGDTPLTLVGAQNWKPHQAQALRHLYAGEPTARRAFRTSALGWGLGLLAESALRVPLVYALPVPVAVGASTAWMITALCAIAVWNAVYITRAARRTPALSVLLPGGGAQPDPDSPTPDRFR